jgi:hypothetical protein
MALCLSTRTQKRSARAHRPTTHFFSIRCACVFRVRTRVLFVLSFAPCEHAHANGFSVALWLRVSMTFVQHSKRSVRRAQRCSEGRTSSLLSSARHSRKKTTSTQTASPTRHCVPFFPSSLNQAAVLSLVSHTFFLLSFSSLSQTILSFAVLCFFLSFTFAVVV